MTLPAPVTAPAQPTPSVVPLDFQRIGGNLAKLQSAGAPQEDIAQYLSEEGTDLATVNASGFGIKPPGAMESAAIGATQGLTANYGDEAASAIAATIGRPGGEAIPGNSWTERYGNALNIARPQQAAAQAAHPYAFGAGQLAGAVAPAIAAPEAFGSKYIAEAPTLGSTVLRSAKVGGIVGGINASGSAEGDVGRQLLKTAEGTAAGATIGALIPVGIDATKKLGTWAWNAAKGLFVPAEKVTEAASVPATGRAVDAAEAIRPRATIDVEQTDRATAINKIAEAARRDGASVEDIQNMLNAAGPEATIADFGKNMQQLLISSTTAPGPGKQIAATALENRQAGQQGRLVDATDKALGGGAGFHETDDALLDRLDTEARPLYKKAYDEAQPVDISSVLDSINSSLNKVPAKSPIRAAVEKVRGMLVDEVKGPDGEGMVLQPYNDLEMLHNAKLAIDDMLSNYGGENSLGKVSKARVTQIKNELLGVMDETNPLYGEARGKFSGIMTAKDALAAGRQFIKSDAEDTAKAMAELDPTDQQFFREGAKRAIVDIIKGTPPDVSVVQQLRKTGLLEKVKALAPDDKSFNKFVQDLNNERRFANTRAATVGGSQTAEKLLGAADLASGATDIIQQAKSPGGLIASMLGKAKQMLGPGEETRALIAKRLSSNDPRVVEETLKAVAYANRLRAALQQGGAVGSVGASGTTGAAIGRMP